MSITYEHHVITKEMGCLNNSKRAIDERCIILIVLCKKAKFHRKIIELGKTLLKQELIYCKISSVI